MKSTADKREREKRMVSEMIALYCRKKHHTKGGLCPECADLEAYARMRSDKCPFMVYVWVFAGPLMLFTQLFLGVALVTYTKKHKTRLEESR